MRGMRTVTQRVQKEYVQSAKPLFRFRWNFAEIGKVGRFAKAEAVDYCFSMDNFHRLKGRAKELHRSIEAVHLHPRNPAKFVIRLENVPKDIFQAVCRGSVSVERDFAFALEAERAYVVQAQNVIGVSVRIKDSVKPLDLFANCLLAEIRRGIDQHRASVIFH